VNNLTFLIEKAAENLSVDWKQAYQEVCLLFQHSKEQKLLEEEEEMAKQASAIGRHWCNGTVFTT
jgi:hypothetical protein